MTTIVDYNYVSSILNTPSASLDVFALKDCADISTQQVCTVEDGTVTVTQVQGQDVQEWTNMITWLVTKQQLFDSEATVKSTLALCDDDKTHHLRAGEVIKVLLEYILMANSIYDQAGYLSDVWSGNVPISGQTMYGASGSASLRNKEGYMFTDMSRVPYGIFSLSQEVDYPATWGSYRASTTWTSPRLACRVSVTAHLTAHYRNQNGTEFDETSTATIYEGSSYLSSGARSWDLLYRARVRGNVLEATFASPDGVLGQFKFGETGTSQALRNDCPLASYDVSITVGGSKDWSMSRTADGRKNVPASYVVPSTRYDYHTPLARPFTVDGLVFDIDTDYTNTASVTVSGSLSDTVRIAYRAAPRQVTASTLADPHIMVPGAMKFSQRPSVIAWFDAAGIFHYDVSVSSGQSIVDTSVAFVPVSVKSATQVMNQAMGDQDRASIWEDFDQVTAEEVQEVLGDRRFINDAYLSTMLDNTVMTMCSDYVREMRAYMVDDDGRMNDPWSITPFMDLTLTAGSAIPMDDFARVRLADDTQYFNITEIPDGSSLVYDDYNHILSATSDVSIHVERFVWEGLSLDEWYAHRDSETGLNEALAETEIDTNTQLLMYAALVSSSSATDWYQSATQMIRDVAEDMKQEARDLLNLVPYNNITVPQRKALSGSVAAIDIPCTYVADMIETAAAMGATSMSSVMTLLDNVPGAEDERYSLTQVQEAKSRSVIRSIVRMSTYGSYDPNCIVQRNNVPSDVPYWTTYTARAGSSIISAGGVESEIADLGTGANAIFPAILNGTVFIQGASYMPDKPLILPMEASLAVVYPMSDSKFTVAWYARHYGGTDYDALRSVQDSYNELARLINIIGADFDLAYTAPEVIQAGFTGQHTYAELAGLGANLAAGALTGAAVGAWGGLAGAGAGAVVGISLASLATEFNMYTEPASVQFNLDYTLSRLEGEAGTLSDTAQQTSTNDPQIIGNLMAALVCACLKHGAYKPYGAAQDLVNSTRYALICPSIPYFRYPYIGEHEDYTPLIMSAMTALTVASAKTCLKAFRHPSRDPTFLPIMVGAGVTNAAVSASSVALERAAERRSPTLAMQNQILDAVEGINVGSSGTYTDEIGTITLRDLSSEMGELTKKVNSVQATVSNQGIALTY